MTEVQETLQNGVHKEEETDPNVVQVDESDMEYIRKLKNELDTKVLEVGQRTMLIDSAKQEIAKAEAELDKVKEVVREKDQYLHQAVKVLAGKHSITDGASLDINSGTFHLNQK